MNSIVILLLLPVLLQSLLLPSVRAFVVERQQADVGSCDFNAVKNSCDFYKCLDERANCGPSGYPLAYGFKYCSRYGEHSSSFTPEGNTFIDGTRGCLIEKLKTLTYDVNKFDCDYIEKAAFDSHPGCYNTNGFCRVFFGNPIAFMTVMAQKDVINVNALKQIVTMGAMCANPFNKCDQ